MPGGMIPETHKRRLDMTNGALAVMGSDVEAAQAVLRPAIPEYCEIVLRGCRQMDRTCLNIYAQAMKLIGAQTELTINLWQRMGARDAAHGTRLVNAGLDAEVMDDEATYHECLRFVSSYRLERGLAPLLVPAEAPSLPAAGLSGVAASRKSRAPVIADPEAS